MVGKKKYGISLASIEGGDITLTMHLNGPPYTYLNTPSADQKTVCGETSLHFFLFMQKTKIQFYSSLSTCYRSFLNDIL